jgi:hypothetical protein
VQSRFKKGQSGNPRGPRPKHLSALLVETLDEPVVVTIDGERGEITKREAVVTWLVNKSTGADPHATKMLIDTLKDAEKKAGVARRVASNGRTIIVTTTKLNLDSVGWPSVADAATISRGSLALLGCRRRDGQPDLPASRHLTMRSGV